MNNEMVAHRFAEGETTGKGSNFFIDGNRLYSYGHHFVVAVRMNWGFLLNGDTYSTSTSMHQSKARSAIRRKNVPAPVIPFSALRQVDTDFADKMNIIEIKDDKSWTEEYKDPITGETKYAYKHELGACLFEVNGNYWLSSIDDNQKRSNQGYFLVQLPEKASSIEDAYKILRPKELGQQDEFLRQGEFFLVPMPGLATKSLTKIEDYPVYRVVQWYHQWYRENFGEPLKHRTNYHTSKWFWTQEEAEKDKTRNAAIEWISNKLNPRMGEYVGVHSTPMGPHSNIATLFENRVSRNSHDATEIRMGPGRSVFIRGTLRHPEHKTVKMGKIWHQVFINRAVRSINVTGGVD